MVTALFRLFVIKLLFVFTIPDCECIHKGFLQASVNDQELHFGTFANIGYKTNYNFKNGEIVNCEFLVKTTNNFRMKYFQSNYVKIFDTRQLKNESFFRALMTEKQNGYYIDISIERPKYIYRLNFILTDGSLPEEPVMVNGLGLFPKPEQNVPARISYLYYYTEGEIPLVDNIFWDDGSMIAPTYGSKNLTGTDKKGNPVQLELRPDTDCNGARMSGFHRKNIHYQYSYSQTINGETNPVCEIHYKYKENDRLNLTCASNDRNDMEIKWVHPGKPANETAPYKSVYLYTSKLFTLSARDNLSTIKCELKYKYSVSAPITETIVKLFMSPNEQRWPPVDTGDINNRVTTRIEHPFNASARRTSGFIPPLQNGPSKPMTTTTLTSTAQSAAATTTTEPTTKLTTKPTTKAATKPPTKPKSKPTTTTRRYMTSSHKTSTGSTTAITTTKETPILPASTTGSGFTDKPGATSYKNMPQKTPSPQPNYYWIIGGLLILCFVIIFIGFIIYLKKRRKSPVAPNLNEYVNVTAAPHQPPTRREGDTTDTESHYASLVNAVMVRNSNYVGGNEYADPSGSAAPVNYVNVKHAAKEANGNDNTNYVNLNLGAPIENGVNYANVFANARYVNKPRNDVYAEPIRKSLRASRAWETVYTYADPRM